MKVWKRSVALLGAVLLWNPFLAAQTATGSISGVVEDASKAVIPSARVVVTNVDTGIARSLASDEAGRYHVPGLIPGPYEVQAQAEGFQTGIRRGIQLTVGSELVINLSLPVGTVAQTTIVTAEAPLVETVSNTLSGLVDDKASARYLKTKREKMGHLLSKAAPRPKRTR